MGQPATASCDRLVEGDWPGQMFALGRLVATPGALRAMSEAVQSPAEFLQRHAAGDWGDLDQEDKLANNRALVEETRIFSAYRTAIGTKLWVITEWDRSVTTILLPEEY